MGEFSDRAFQAVQRGDHLELRTDYFDAHSIESVISAARKTLAGADFDTMVGTGMSGALVIPYLATALGKKWLVFRKFTENSHAGLAGDGDLGRRWIFVDDFISTGHTLRRCQKLVDTLAALNNFDTKFIGYYSYKYDNFVKEKAKD